MVNVILDSMTEKMETAAAKNALELKNVTEELKSDLVTQLGKDSEHLKQM